MSRSLAYFWLYVRLAQRSSSTTAAHGVETVQPSACTSVRTCSHCLCPPVTLTHTPTHAYAHNLSTVRKVPDCRAKAETNRLKPNSLFYLNSHDDVKWSKTVSRDVTEDHSLAVCTPAPLCVCGRAHARALQRSHLCDAGVASAWCRYSKQCPWCVQDPVLLLFSGIEC